MPLRSVEATDGPPDRPGLMPARTTTPPKPPLGASSTDAARPPDPTRWSALAEPSQAVIGATRSRLANTTMTSCGVTADAVVIAPLARGLAALDVLYLPMSQGYRVIADYIRQELIVEIPCGDGAALHGLQGVRVLGEGGWLLTSARPPGVLSAAWLSHSKNAAGLDASRLRGRYGKPMKPGPPAAEWSSEPPAGLPAVHRPGGQARHRVRPPHGRRRVPRHGLRLDGRLASAGGPPELAEALSLPGEIRKTSGVSVAEESSVLLLAARSSPFYT